MSPKQKKLAAKAPPPNKLDEKDFKVLREEKAKGRGMGLQDEKVQPGKVIKARDSKFIERRKKLSNMSEFQKRRLKLESKKIGGVMKAKKGKSAMVPLKKGYSKTLGVFPTIDKVKPSVGGSGSGISKGTDKVSTKKAEDFMKRRKKLAGSKLPGRIGTALGAVSMLVPAAYAAAKQYKDYKSAKNRDKAKVKKMGGGMMKKYSKGGGADSGRIGEMKSRLAVAADRVDSFRKARGKVSPRDYDKITERTKTYALAQSMKDKDRLTDRDIKKASSLVKGKMGGGMMQKPMGYRSGGHYDDKNKNVVKHIRVKKKMGGGMIGPSQTPGYSKGTMVKARGCKLGRTRPTKIT
jgi:hypothetical protein